MQWLTRALLASAYPGAPHARRSFALELLNAVLECWAEETWVATPLCAPAAQGGAPAVSLNSSGREDPAARYGFQPFCPGLVSAETTQLLLSAAGDSWEKLRVASMAALARLPTPLPGLESREALLPLVRCARRSARGARGRRCAWRTALADCAAFAIELTLGAPPPAHG
jgi:hypothetical protein